MSSVWYKADLQAWRVFLWLLLTGFSVERADMVHLCMGLRMKITTRGAEATPGRQMPFAKWAPPAPSTLLPLVNAGLCAAERADSNGLGESVCVTARPKSPRPSRQLPAALPALSGNGSKLALTVVRSQERCVVQAVLHKARLSVQNCNGCDATSVGVNPQPVGRIRELGVSRGREQRFRVIVIKIINHLPLMK